MILLFRLINISMYDFALIWNWNYALLFMHYLTFNVTYIITHCLGLGYETMVCAVWFSLHFSYQLVGTSLFIYNNTFIKFMINKGLISEPVSISRMMHKEVNYTT